MPASFYQKIQEFMQIKTIPRISKVLGTPWIFLKVLESAWFVGFSGKSLPALAACIFKNIHEIPSFQLGKTLSLEFHEYSKIFRRPIPASYFKLIQAVEIP